MCLIEEMGTFLCPLGRCASECRVRSSCWYSRTGTVNPRADGEALGGREPSSMGLALFSGVCYLLFTKFSLFPGNVSQSHLFLVSLHHFPRYFA